MEVIASRKNPLVAQMRRVAAGDDPDRMLLDGVHLLEEARAAQTAIHTVAVTPRALASADGLSRLVTALGGVGVRVVQCADPIVEAMSPAAAPSGEAAAQYSAWASATCRCIHTVAYACDQPRSCAMCSVIAAMNAARGSGIVSMLL